jgi:nucleotide-binding universal stress UspA family protein
VLLVVYKRILVPLDGSKVAEVALPYARFIAEMYGSELTLLTICAPKCDDRFKRLCRAYLDLQAGELEPQGIKTSSTVIHGNIAENITNFSIKKKIDLIIVASHGYSGFKRFTMGSVTQKVIFNTFLPVIIIKPAATKITTIRFTKILLPLDGSLFSEASISHVEELAGVSGAEVILLTISEPPEIPSDRSPAIKPTWEEYRDALIQEVEDQGTTYLESVRAKLKEKGIKTSIRFVMGNAAESIIQIAEEEEVDLIAMTTHGHTGVNRWVYGNMTGRIVDESPRPVLIIHPDPLK